jgi:uncharacterized protein (UPF0335 family)
MPPTCGRDMDDNDEMLTESHDTTKRRVLTGDNVIHSEDLIAILDGLEELQEKRKEVSEEIKEAFYEAEGKGYDAKTLRTILKLRAMDAEDRVEVMGTLEAYAIALWPEMQ